MALACLAAEAEHAGEKLRRQGFAAIDGSAVDLAAAAATFDALQPEAETPTPVPPDHPLVAALLSQPAVRNLVADSLGASPRVAGVAAFDQQTQLPVSWHQEGRSAEDGLTLLWYLDLIGPADGALRVLPGSHRKGRLALEENARLAQETPAVELPVSAGTVLAIAPLLVRGCRRRTTRGHRRILQVELAKP